MGCSVRPCMPRLGRRRARAAAEPGAGQRDPAVLPRRLPDLLRERAARRLSLPRMPQPKCAELVARLPAGGERDRRRRAVGAESRSGTGPGRPRYGRTRAGAPSAAADDAAAGAGSDTPRLRPGFSHLLRRRAARGRPDPRLSRSKRPLSVAPMPLGADVRAAGSLERQVIGDRWTQSS